MASFSGFFSRKKSSVTAPEHPSNQNSAAKLQEILVKSKSKNVIAVASGKGGVGKSTVATHLSMGLKFYGADVGLLDADIYGPSQNRMMGSFDTQQGGNEKGEILPLVQHGVKMVSMGNIMNPNSGKGKDAPLVWRAPIANKVMNQFIHGVDWGHLDFLIIDLPPGTGDVQLTLAQQAKLSGVVIVTTPQEVALGIAKKGLQMFRELNVPILGIVENMSGFHCEECGHENKIFKEGGGEKLARSLKVPYLGAIPLDTALVEAGDSGVPVLVSDPNSISAQAFLSVTANVLKELDALAGVDSVDEPIAHSILPSGELKVEWRDGKQGTLAPFLARTQCGCALCVEETTGRRLLDPTKIPLEIQFQSVHPVGRYALSLAFSDGHKTGIFPYKKIKAMIETQPSPHSPHTPPAESFTV